MRFVGVILVIATSISVAACDTLAGLQELVKPQPVTTRATPAPPTQAERDAAAVREACREEVLRLCSQISPSTGTLTQCITKNRAKLSEPCRALYQVQSGAS